MSLPSVDAVVVILYLAGVIGLGFWFTSRSRTTAGFMIASGGVPGWAIGISIFGTFLSSNTFLGVPGKAYATNWNAFAFSLSLPLAAWIAAKWFVPFHRHSGSVSAYDHLEKRFGPWARTYGVVCYLLTQLARVGAVLFGVSLVIAVLTGWSQATIIIVSGVLVTAYTALGGIEAVIWTDVVQSVVLAVGAILLLVLLLFGVPGGPAQAVEIAATNGKLSLGSFAFDLTRSTFWVPLLYGLFENLKNFGIDQSYVQRYHAAPDEAQARRSVWLGAMLYLPISAVFFAIGSSAFAYYQTHPELLQEVKTEVAARLDASSSQPVAIDSISEEQVGDSVLPHFIVNGLPPGLTGLLVAAIFSAAMSSIDTSLNSSATVTLLDIYQRRWRPDCGERESMLVLYGTTILMGAAGVAVAVAMIGISSVLDAWWTLSGVFTGGLLGLFLLGILARRVERPAAICAVIIGLLVIAWMTLPGLLLDPNQAPFWVNPLHAHLTVVVGTLTVFLVGVTLAKISAFRSSLA